MNEAREIYGDIIDLDRPISTKHPPMSKLNRAAQFAPYATLEGYDYLLKDKGEEITPDVSITK